MQDCWPRLISLAIKYYVTEGIPVPSSPVFKPQK